MQNGAKMEEMARKSKIGRSPCRSKASLAHGKFIAGSLASGSLPSLRDTVWQSPIRRRSWCQQCEEARQSQEVAPSTARHRRRWASGRTQAHMRTARPPPDRSAARALRSERAAHAHFSASGRCGPRSQEVAPSTACHRRRWASGRTQAHMRAARLPPDRAAARALRSERAAYAHFSASGRCGPRSQAEVTM